MHDSSAFHRVPLPFMEIQNGRHHLTSQWN